MVLLGTHPADQDHPDHQAVEQGLARRDVPSQARREHDDLGRQLAARPLQGANAQVRVGPSVLRNTASRKSPPSKKIPLGHASQFLVDEERAGSLGSRLPLEGVEVQRYSVMICRDSDPSSSRSGCVVRLDISS